MHPFIWLWHHLTPEQYDVMILTEAQHYPRNCPFVEFIKNPPAEHFSLFSAAVKYRDSPAWKKICGGEHRGDVVRSGTRTHLGKSLVVSGVVVFGEFDS